MADPGRKKKDKRKYKCSCGRTFSHKISLKRHRFVSGCPEVGEEGAPEEEAPAEAASEEAPPPAEPEPEPEPVAARAREGRPRRERPSLRREAHDEEETTPVPRPVNPRLGRGQPLTPTQPRTPAPVARSQPEVEWGQLALKCLLFLQTFCGWLGSEMGKLGGSAGKAFNSTAKLAGQVAWRAAVVVLLFGGVYVLSGVLSRPGEARVLLPETGPSSAGAAATVLTYHRHLQDSNYLRAYASLTPSWQNELSFPDFEQVCAGLGEVSYRLLGIEPSQDFHQAWAHVELSTYHQGRVRQFTGYYLMVYHEELGWRLAESHLSLKAVGPAYASTF